MREWNGAISTAILIAGKIVKGMFFLSRFEVAIARIWYTTYITHSSQGMTIRKEE